jgi:hypothetical protein
MRKQIVGKPGDRDAVPQRKDWLDLDALARVELTSEDPSHPFEAAIRADPESGWRAADAGAQTLRLLFDKPTRVRHIQLLFRETGNRRTQEFVLHWRSGEDTGVREIVRQQYHFSPPDTTEELEQYDVELDGLTELELTIIPDISGGPAQASLAHFRIA